MTKGIKDILFKKRLVKMLAAWTECEPAAKKILASAIGDQNKHLFIRPTCSALKLGDTSI